MFAHDRIAQQAVQSSSDQPPPDDFNIPDLAEVGSSIKLVQLDKTTEPLVCILLAFCNHGVVADVQR